MILKKYIPLREIATNHWTEETIGTCKTFLVYMGKSFQVFTFGLFMHMLNFTMRRDQRMQSINFTETYDKKTLAAWNTMRPSVKKKLPLNLPMHQEGQYLTYIEKKRNHCF